MSGALLSGIGAATAVGSILFGDVGAVVLGPVVFNGLEVPASLSWGGKQALKVHRFPGGARVIDAMGRDDMALSWSGIFMGGGATQRALQLDELRVTGRPVPLSWGQHLYTVVVSDFRADDKAFRTEYRITCEVLRDESADPASAPPSLLAQITDDINTALAIAAPVFELIGLGSAILNQLGTTQTAIQMAGSVTAGDDSSAAILTDVQATQAAVVTAQTAAEAAVTTAAPVVVIGASGVDPGTAVATIPMAAAQIGADAACRTVAALLGRVVDNITITPGATDAVATFDTTQPPAQSAPIGGGAGTTAIVSGGNLFAIAAQQFGDATQAFRIAQASGLSDPMLAGLATLTIPDAIPSVSAGVAATGGSVIL